MTRLPDFLMQRWKTQAFSVRERGETPSLEHISDFIRRQVQAEFDPDFGDLQREMRPPQRDSKPTPGKGIHATQASQPREPREVKCYISEADHKVSDCPTLKDSSVAERFELVKAKRLCFSCLRKGHTTRECRSKKRCERNGCQRNHHHLLHNDPPVASSVKSILDQSGILPVVRVQFRSDSGRCLEEKGSPGQWSVYHSHPTGFLQGPRVTRKEFSLLWLEAKGLKRKKVEESDSGYRQSRQAKNST